MQSNIAPKPLTESPVVHGRLTNELINQIKEIIPSVKNHKFTGEYKRDLMNPSFIATNRVIDYLAVSRLNLLMMGSESVLESDRERFKTGVVLSVDEMLDELVEAPRSLVVDVMICLGIQKKEIGDVKIFFKGSWLLDGVRLYHPAFPVKKPEEADYLWFKECTLSTDEFLKSLWKYIKTLYNVDDRHATELIFVEKDGEWFVKFSKPEYNLTPCFRWTV